MSERHTTIGTSNRSIRTPAGNSRPASIPADPSARIPETRRRRAPLRDPYDLKTAFSRLTKLLQGDRGQPRKDVQDRGYYLNILV